MNVEEHVPLKTLTTLRVGGNALVVASCESIEEVRAALTLSRERGLPLYVLGEGSNVLASDQGYEGIILRMNIPGLSFEEEGNRTLVRSGAGVSWDTLVHEAAERELWGVENLAGIPGFVGAAPVQNIGAYGADLKDTLLHVDALDARTGEVLRLSREECMLEYRDSKFKREPFLIITSVTLSLSKDPSPRIEYGDLLKAKERGEDLSTPKAIGAVVRSIRSGKFPDRSHYGTAGSFFKNPVLTPEVYEKLVARFGPVPQFPNPKGIKIPLAFVLDKVLGLRGYRKGNAWLFGAQPLVLVIDPEGTAQDIESLAQEIEARVKEATGIEIEREVRSLPHH